MRHLVVLALVLAIVYAVRLVWFWIDHSTPPEVRRFRRWRTRPRYPALHPPDPTNILFLPPSAYRRKLG